MALSIEEFHKKANLGFATLGSVILDADWMNLLTTAGFVIVYVLLYSPYEEICCYAVF